MLCCTSQTHWDRHRGWKNRKIGFSCLPVTFSSLCSTWNLHRGDKCVQFLVILIYMSWKAGKTKVGLASEESKRQKWILVWGIRIFSARIFSSTMKELAQKCRIFSLNDFLKGFSGSSSYLVLLRKAKIIHYEKYVVYSLFLCFGPKQGSLWRSDSIILIDSLVMKSKEQLDSTVQAHLPFQCIKNNLSEMTAWNWQQNKLKINHLGKNVSPFRVVFYLCLNTLLQHFQTAKGSCPL